MNKHLQQTLSQPYPNYNIMPNAVQYASQAMEKLLHIQQHSPTLWEYRFDCKGHFMVQSNRGRTAAITGFTAACRHGEEIMRALTVLKNRIEEMVSCMNCQQQYKNAEHCRA